VRYACDSLTEEFFDLENDPEENVNLIHHSAYQSLVNEYRMKLDSIRLVLGDTTISTTEECTLADPSYYRHGNEEQGDVFALSVSPNPADEDIFINLRTSGSAPVSISIYNAIGQAMYTVHVQQSAALILPVSIKDYAPGHYTIVVQQQDSVLKTSFIASH
jgi:hypothetical protein